MVSKKAKKSFFSIVLCGPQISGSDTTVIKHKKGGGAECDHSGYDMFTVRLLD